MDQLGVVGFWAALHHHMKPSAPKRQTMEALGHLPKSIFAQRPLRAKRALGLTEPLCPGFVERVGRGPTLDRNEVSATVDHQIAPAVVESTPAHPGAGLAAG